MITGTSSYTHRVCWWCGRTLWCSEGIEFDSYGLPTGFATCAHVPDHEAWDHICSLDPPDEGDWHLCDFDETGPIHRNVRGDVIHP